MFFSITVLIVMFGISTCFHFVTVYPPHTSEVCKFQVMTVYQNTFVGRRLKLVQFGFVCVSFLKLILKIIVNVHICVGL